MSQKLWPNKRRPNKTARIAFGYKVSEDDPLVLVPDLEITFHMEQALKYLDEGNSLRKTAEWLTAQAGRTISHQGLSKIWKDKRQGDEKTARVQQLAKTNKQRKPKTKAAKQEAEIRKKIAGAKRSLTVAEKKIRKPVSKTENFSASLDHNAELPQREVVFKPNEGPQTDFLAASEREVLYGGSAGGGKTLALIADPMRYFHNRNFNGLLLRRTNDELREIQFKTLEMYPKAFPGAKWQERKSQWVFPSGARLWLTYLDRDEDVLRYQGQAFSYVAFDELTQHSTPFAYNYLRSRLRTTDPELPLCMRSTTNPGGPGHQWVKKMFIDPAPPNTKFAATDLDTGDPLVFPDGTDKAGEPLFYRRFIPASLYDNPYLTVDGAYEANLLSLPEMQRRQLLEGDWNVAEGAAFPEFRVNTHVVEPFDIPRDWRRFRSCDYGYSSFSAVHWYAVDPSFETLIVYRELYVSKLTGKALARAVLDRERNEQIDYGVLDSSCWHQRGQIGPSIAEEMIRMGCRWRPSDRSAGSRVAGKNRLHELLKVDEDIGKPGIIIFNTCRQLISDLPVIPSDPKGSDDIDPRYKSDHTFDSIRYGIQSRYRGFSPWDTILEERQTYMPSDATFGY